MEWTLKERVEYGDRPPPPTRAEIWKARLPGLLFTFAAVLFNLVFLLPEVTVPVYEHNDHVLHLSLTRNIEENLGESGTDPWLSHWGTGYPLTHFYPHLPHTVLAWAHRLLPGETSLQRLFALARLLLFMLFPVSFFLGAYWMRFPPLAAGITAAVSVLISTNELFGLDPSSYTWLGHGLFGQQAAAVVAPAAIGAASRWIRDARGLPLAAILGAVVCLSHVVLGFIYMVTLVFFLLGPFYAGNYQTPSRRGMLLVLALVLITAHFILPGLLENEWMNRSAWEEDWKYDSFGALEVLKSLVRGELFDGGGLPFLTVVCLAGAILTFLGKGPARPWLAGMFILWLALYCGRPTFGFILNRVPLIDRMHFHRMIAGVHLAGIFLIGSAFYWTWKSFARRKRSQAIVLVLILFLTVPAFVHQALYLLDNGEAKKEQYRAQQIVWPDFEELVEHLKGESPARVYVAGKEDWGRDVRMGKVHLYGVLPARGFDLVSYYFHALSPTTDVQAAFNREKELHRSLFNVRWILSREEEHRPASVRRVGRFGPYLLYESPRSAKTTGYVGVVRARSSLLGGHEERLEASLRWMKSALPAYFEYVALFSDKGAFESRKADFERTYEAETVTPSKWPLLPGAIQAPPGRVLEDSIDPHRGGTARVHVVEADAYALLKMTYLPGWKAFVDGVETEAINLTPGFVGVPVKQGTHTIEFLWEPDRSLGRDMGYVAILVVALLFIEPYRRFRSNRTL